MFEIKNGKLKMYSISDEYRDYLSKFDKKVSLKDNRKYYGILVCKEDMEYYIPFTSKVNKKTSKKLTIDIKNQKGELIAKLLLNNMIPVKFEDARIVDIDNSKYKTYFKNEIRYLHNNNIKKEIINKINYLFAVLENEKHHDYDFFKQVCCDFEVLEDMCKKYDKNKKYKI